MVVLEHLIQKLEKVMTEMYESESCVITSSGLSAITITLLTFLDKNSECLITQNCYEPVYNFAVDNLKKFWNKNIFFECNNISKFSKLITSKTKVIYLESPGSINFEVEDLEKIISIAKKNTILQLYLTILGLHS